MKLKANDPTKDPDVAIKVGSVRISEPTSLEATPEHSTINYYDENTTVETQI